MDYWNLITTAAKRKQNGLRQHTKQPQTTINGILNEPKPKPKKHKKTPETIVTDLISRYLIDAGYLVVKVNSSNLFNQASQMPLRSYIIRNTGASSGFPDLLAMKNGEVLLIEVKSETGRLSESQERFRDLCTKHKVRYIVARDIKDIELYVNFDEV